MAATARVICASGALAEAGDGVRFEVVLNGRPVPAFVIRFEGEVRGYLNQCAHVAMELDWMPGKFLDSSRTVLVCSTHGALYDPATGSCVGGPCRGARLTPVAVAELNGSVLLRGDP